MTRIAACLIVLVSCSAAVAGPTSQPDKNARLDAELKAELDAHDREVMDRLAKLQIALPGAAATQPATGPDNPLAHARGRNGKLKGPTLGQPRLDLIGQTDLRNLHVVRVLNDNEAIVDYHETARVAVGGKTSRFLTEPPTRTQVIATWQLLVFTSKAAEWADHTVVRWTAPLWIVGRARRDGTLYFVAVPLSPW